MTIENYTVRELLVPLFERGAPVYTPPAVLESAGYAKRDLATFWDEYKRLLNPQPFKVDISDGLYDLKQKLIREKR